MTYRILAAAPVVLALALFAVALALPDVARGDFLRRATQSAKLLGALGAGIAALSFARGDYLRRAWALQALNMVLIARDLIFYAWIPREARILGVEATTINLGIIVVANVVGVAAAWAMARAWRVAGLEPDGSRARRALVALAALGLALAITGVPLVRHLQALGGAVPFGAVASGLGDTLSICLIAPVLLTVLAMRGGILVWPWGLVTASMFSWLLYDASFIMTRAGPGNWSAFFIGAECARFLACTLMFSAGLAQRHAITSLRGAADEP